MRDTLICVADPHIKWHPKRPDLMYSMRVLTEVLEMAVDHKADIMILGDLIDQYSRIGSTPLPVLIALTDWFHACRLAGVKPYWIRGNHITKDHANPETSIIKVFRNIAATINYPCAKETDDYFVSMVPWYPRYKMEDIFTNLSIGISKMKKLKYLFTHLPIKEAETDNGHSVTDAMSVEKLYPSQYSRILLGDFHRRQTVKYSHVQYLGVPTPRKANDEAYFSVHKLHLPTNTLSELELRNFYPEYKTWKITNEAQSVITGYDARHYNKIICPADMTGKVQILYPEAQVDGVGEISGEVYKGRTEDMDILDNKSIWKNVCAQKELGAKYLNTGLRYLDDENSSN